MSPWQLCPHTPRELHGAVLHQIVLLVPEVSQVRGDYRMSLFSHRTEEETEGQRGPPYGRQSRDFFPKPGLCL